MDISSYKANYQADYYLDLCGLNCPMPLLKTKQKLNAMQPGESLFVIATDAGSKRDFASFISLTSHEMLLTNEQDGAYIYLIKKGK